MVFAGRAAAMPTRLRIRVGKIAREAVAFLKDSSRFCPPYRREAIFGFRRLYTLSALSWKIFFFSAALSPAALSM
jgi:hypothetical protein